MGSCVSLVTLSGRDVPVAAAGDSGKRTGQCTQQQDRIDADNLQEEGASGEKIEKR